MNTNIRMTCSNCHDDIKLPADKVLLRICLDFPNERSTYIFTCNLCGELCIKAAPEEIIQQLLGAVGIRVVEWSLPIELLEIPDDDGKTINLDDVLDLNLLFENEENFWKEVNEDVEG